MKHVDAVASQFSVWKKPKFTALALHTVYFLNVYIHTFCCFYAYILNFPVSGYARDSKIVYY